MEDYDGEEDAELKISTSIHYHRLLERGPIGASPEHLAKLTADLCAVGPDLEERRAAAFAGMLILGRVTDIVSMTDYGGNPLNISSGSSYGNESESLMALISEKWDELSTAFGSDLVMRFGRFGAEDLQLWDCIAPHIQASPYARRDFLKFCRETDTTLHLKGVVALAKEQPRSDLLLEHCLRILDDNVSGRQQPHSPWEVQRTRLEIAYILREQFADRPAVSIRIKQAFNDSPDTALIVAISLICPHDSLLDHIDLTALTIGRQRWVAALHLSAVKSDPKEFIATTFAMLNRKDHVIWDFQDVINRAIVERLRRDSESVELMKNRLTESPSTSEIASLPRFLYTAGAWDEEINKKCALLLEIETREPLPRAGFEANDNSIRAVSKSLLEVVTQSNDI